MSGLTREEVADLVRQYGRECANAVESFRTADPDLDAVLDPVCAQMERAEQTAATVCRLREMAGTWAQVFDNAITEEGKTLRDAGRAILHVLDGEPE